MIENRKYLGTVKLVQLQPNGLIIEKSSGYFYDETRRVEVDQLLINKKGIEATTPNGVHVLDIHHLDHPDKEYDDDDLVCIGFTSHYDKMRESFGDHIVYGSAGENIIIDTGIEKNNNISIYFDPMIAKTVCWAQDRASCIEKVLHNLDNTFIVGVNTP